MPILRIEEKLVYFAHVPKCAGTSVEEYAIKRFGPIALQDRRFFDLSPVTRWSRTSPQHIDAASLERLFPREFFVDGFTIVRHPVHRLISAFRHAQRHRGLTWVGFPKFMERLERDRDQDPFGFDNHFRPMSDLVPDWTTTVLKLEDGEAPIIAYFDRLAGNQDGPRALPHAQKGHETVEPAKGLRGFKRMKERPSVPLLTEELCRRIHAVYREDYERFGYGWDDILHEKTVI